MKAITYTQYGSPDVLKLEEIPTPTPKDNEVLVKIYASSINSADLDYLKGIFLIRLGGFFKPRHRILGTDIAGKVEVVGRNVTEFQVGDEVFADLTDCGFGSFAEYVCVPENVLVHKPKNLTFAQAGAIPTAGMIAFQGLREVQAGQKVLINGAGGGVGTLGIQLAKHLGAEVTGVDSGEKLDMLRSIGADHVIDYRQEDFTKSGQQYDLILDVIALRSSSDYQRALTPTGKFSMVGGSIGVIFRIGAIEGVRSQNKSQKLGLLIVKPNQADLIQVKELVEAGKIKPIIDREYPLHEIGQALRQLEAGKVKGKVVITMQHAN